MKIRAKQQGITLNEKSKNGHIRMTSNMTESDSDTTETADAQTENATQCSHCEESIGYEAGWDDPPKGEGHIEVIWNPADKPDFIVSETRTYCSVECVLVERDELPLSGPGDPDSPAGDSK